MRARFFLIAISAMASPALAQDQFYRPPATHDELFGIQGYLPPSVPLTPALPGRPAAGTRLNPALGGMGNVPLGDLVTRRIGPADTTQNDPSLGGSHDDLQYSPR